MKWTLEFVSTPTNWLVLYLKLSESSYSLDLFFFLRLVTVHKIMKLWFLSFYVFSVCSPKLLCLVSLLSFMNSTVIKNIGAILFLGLEYLFNPNILQP